VTYTRFKFAIAALVFSAGIASPGLTEPAQAPTLQALATLQPGQWDLKPRAGMTGIKSMCLSDMKALLQVRHAGASCNRFVIANDSRQTIVQYTCPKNGHGRTLVKVETPRLVQIESQGIADNEPFAIVLEGRRVGACPSAAGGRLQAGRR
jgi:hypothetical protein